MRATLIFIIVLFSCPAAAGFYTGNDLYVSCSMNKQLIWGFVSGSFDKAELDFGYLTNYWMATIDSIETKEQTSQHMNSLMTNSAATKGYCEPSGINLSQVSDVYCQFLTANPAKRHMAASVLFNEALSAAWPCKTSQKK